VVAARQSASCAKHCDLNGWLAGRALGRAEFGFRSQVLQQRMTAEIAAVSQGQEVAFRFAASPLMLYGMAMPAAIHHQLCLCTGQLAYVHVHMCTTSHRRLMTSEASVGHTVQPNTLTLSLQRQASVFAVLVPGLTAQ
jgi:hypothetical protein